MIKSNFMDKYPIHSLEIQKSETTYTSVNEIIEYLQSLILKHPVATFISVFDHYKHTSSLEGATIHPEIKDAQNILFCFGKQLTDRKLLAVRPRSIGVSELENSFEISFLEVPNEQLNSTVQTWVKKIANK
ncbi:MAG: hypothetical protein QM497_00605 [Sulfurimonas sp.]